MAAAPITPFLTAAISATGRLPGVFGRGYAEAKASPTHSFSASSIGREVTYVGSSFLLSGLATHATQKSAFLQKSIMPKLKSMFRVSSNAAMNMLTLAATVVAMSASEIISRTYESFLKGRVSRIAAPAVGAGLVAAPIALAPKAATSLSKAMAASDDTLSNILKTVGKVARPLVRHRVACEFASEPSFAARATANPFVYNQAQRPQFQYHA